MSVDGRSIDHTGSAQAEHLQAQPRGGVAAGDALLLQVAAGDHEAFESLYLELAPGVFSLASRVAGDPGVAEQVTSDVFAALWIRACSFDPSRGTARTWAAILTYRLAKQAATFGVATPQQQLVVALVYFGGLTASQVAGELGLPVQTVTTQLRDGLRGPDADAERTA